MKADLRRGLRLTVVAWIISVTVACDGANQLRNGMPEAEVIRLLGEPRVVTTPAFMSDFFFEEKEKSCLPRATKVFVYDRWIRNDVSVAVDTKGTVVCFEVVMSF